MNSNETKIQLSILKEETNSYGSFIRKTSILQDSSQSKPKESENYNLFSSMTEAFDLKHNVHTKNTSTKKKFSMNDGN